MAVLSPSIQLKKDVSLFGVYTIATGATLSSGFFLLPALAAAEAGPAVVLSYLIAIPPLLPGVLSKIELATAMPRAGGEYYFLDRSLGPLVGTVAGLGTWCGLVLKTTFALIGIGAYLGVFLPNVPAVPMACVLAVVIGLINLYGSRRSTAFQSVMVLVLLVLLVWFTSTGLFHIDPGHLSGFFDKGFDGVMGAAGLVCVSFMGLTNVASVAEEVKDPERNLTVGVFAALATAVVVYGLGTLVIVGVVPPQDLYLGAEPSLTPVADAAELLVGRWGAVVMTIAAVLAFLSVANAGILSASRYPLAMSRDHLLPAWLRRLNRHRTPQNGVLVTVGFIVLCVTLLDPTRIAKLASAFLLMLFALNCMAVLVMRESRIESYDPGFRAPLYPWLQLAGIVGPALFIAMMGWLPMLFTTGLITTGVAWYFYYARARVARGGAIYHLFARLGQRRFEGLDRELRGILKEKGLRAGDPYDEVVARAPVLNLDGPVTFEQAVRGASELLAMQLPLSAEQLATSFMDGTRIGATPTSKGVALPHLRVAGIDQARMVLCRATAGVHIDVLADFVKHDQNERIHAIIFLVSPDKEAAQHLRVLAQVAQHVDDDRFMVDWLKAGDDHDLRAILLRDERFVRLQLRPGTPAAELIGTTAGDVSLPDGSLLALIYRRGDEIFPTGDTALENDDVIIIVGLPQSIEQIKQKYIEPGFPR